MRICRGHLRARNRPRRLFRPGDASLSSPSADRLDVVRRALAPARLRRGEGGRRQAACITPPPCFCRMRSCRCASGPATAPMSALARNSDGDELVFVHQGEGDLFCDFGHLSYREGDYIVLPRGTMWRLEPKARTVALLDRGDGRFLQAARPRHSGPARAIRSGDARHAEARRRRSARNPTSANGKSSSNAAASSRPSPIRSIRSMRWAGRATSPSCASTGATSAR